MSPFPEGTETCWKGIETCATTGFKKAETLYSIDVKAIKGIFGIYSETLRDFGIQPEKKRKGKQPKKG